MDEIKKNMDPDYGIHGLFPSPVYITKRDLGGVEEDKEIADLVKEKKIECTDPDNRGSYTENTYLFATNLKKLKEFCEQHLKIYTKEVLKIDDKIDFYITQSWINVLEPGGNIHSHWHANSIVSGCFYVATGDDDSLMFSDSNKRLREMISLQQKEFNIWNSTEWFVPSNDNELLLFPSWLVHGVIPNEQQTKDVISLSFNTFVRGTLGSNEGLTELIL